MNPEIERDRERESEEEEKRRQLGHSPKTCPGANRYTTYPDNKEFISD